MCRCYRCHYFADYVDVANDVNCGNFTISSVSADYAAEVEEVCDETACVTKTYQQLLFFMYVPHAERSAADLLVVYIAGTTIGIR